MRNNSFKFPIVLVGVSLILIFAYSNCGEYKAIEQQVSQESSQAEPVPTESASPVESATPFVQPSPPSFFFGYFATGADAPKALRIANTVVVIPSWSEDAALIAKELEAKNAFAFVSTHHVFGNPKDTWDRDWKKTRDWFAPIEKAGRLLGVYVVDEPLHNGMKAADVEAAVAIVRSAGYKTFVAETEEWARKSARPSVTWFGVTCYIPSPQECISYYAARPDWNLVIGRGFDVSAATQQTWFNIAKNQGRAGVVYWVWSWAGQKGVADDPALLKEHERLFNLIPK